MERIPKNIALVYDHVNKWGGAERVLLALHDLFPKAPLYTSVYDPDRAKWARVFPQVITSFLQKIPFVSNRHEFIPFLTPLAFETFSFSEYDAVISVTSSDAKGIITPPGTFHLCYCLTPTRYLWSHNQEYIRQLGPALEFISRPAFKYLKFWDKIAAHRPDAYIAISETVRKRIKDFYGLESGMVYPPVSVSDFKPSAKIAPGSFFLYVGRLVPYKKADVIVTAFSQAQLPLVVAGSGSLSIGVGSFEQKVRRLAGPTVRFLGQVTNAELISLYHNCRALVFFHEEDFGIVPVEAQAAGKPVIALNRGGTSETVIHRKTGLLINDDSVAGLVKAIKTFDDKKFDSKYIIKHAEKFSLERFNQEFVKVFTSEWQKYSHISMS